MQLKREVEFLRTSRQGSINGNNQLRRVDPRNILNVLQIQAYVNSVNDLIQLNQNEQVDLQNQDADRDDDDVKINENESIRQCSFTDDDRNSTIQGVQMQ